MGAQTIQAIVFDAYGTLFDVESVRSECDACFPGFGGKIAEIWRNKQIEYTFLCTLMRQYRPFSDVTRSALRFALKESGVGGSQEEEDVLMSAYEHLSPDPYLPSILTQLKSYKKVIFSNGTKKMLKQLLRSSNMEGEFDAILSVDDIRQYKPSPQAYALVTENLGVHQNEVLFVTANSWDAVGAQSFGFQTVWVNRKQAPQEELNARPWKVIDRLSQLPALLTAVEEKTARHSDGR